MANPPVKSVVFKTSKPTTPQTTLTRTQKQIGVKDAYAQAVKSGRILGTPSDLGGITNREATSGPGARPVIAPNYGGAVGTLTAGIKPKPLPNAPVAKAKVKITVHPSGKIEVHSSGHTPSPVPTLSTTPKGGTYQTDSQGRTDTTLTVRPKSKAPVKTQPRTTAAAPAAGPQLSDTQLAANQVSAAFDPVAKQLQDFYTQQTQGEANAIKDATSGLADLYKQYAPAAASAYTGAENSQAAVGAALSKALVGQSDAAQAGLAAQLAKIGNPDSAAVINGQAAGNAQGAQGVQAAGNSAALTGLIGRGAVAQDYGAKLPGLAGLYGLTATKNATSKLGSDFNTAIQALDAKRPEALQTALAGISANKYKQQQLDLENKAFGLKVNADTRAQQALDNQTAKTLSDLYGVDANGNLTLAGRKVAALETKAQAALKGAGKTKPLTTAQVNGLTEKASKDAETFYYGVSPKLYQGQPVAGTGTPPILYPAAVQRLMAKYPGLTLSRAQKILNSYYKPGEGGRPVFTKKQQQANSVAFPDPFATLPGVTG